jgi:hypothetical protein
MQRGLYQVVHAIFCAGALCISAAVPTTASVLDWNSVDWTDASAPYSQSFVVDGVTVTISITGDVGNFIPIGGDNSPDDNLHQTGGFAGQESLYLAVNHTSDTQSITVTITFSVLVDNVTFSLFDVDYTDGGFTDMIDDISATNGTTNYAASITSSGGGNTIDINNNNTLSANVIGDDTADEGTNDGNANFSFGGNDVNSITFTYGNDPSTTPSNPSQQSIGLGDINFTIVPEPSTSFAAAFVVLAAGFHGWRRRSTFSAPPAA